jgi:NAD dependent epimerase/dehydratase
MDLNGRRILVTGADGFIGSHLVEELVSRGHSVRAFVMYNSFNSWGWLDSSPPDVRANMEVVAGDIRDPFCVRAAMDGCDVVFHLAALIAIPFSYTSPDAYVQTNVAGTLNVLQAAREIGVKRVVHTSTSETYGTARYVPIDEEHPLNAQSPYAATKIAADQLALSFQRSFGTPVAVLRPFNTYGPRQSARAVIPTAITQIASGQRAIRLGALTPTRDFSFVTDTARAFIAVAESDAALGQIVNSGSSFEISVGDTVNLISEVMGVQVKIECDEQRLRPKDSEVERLFASTSKIQRLTDWTPEYGGLNGFRKGIAKTASWFANPVNLAKYRIGRYVV